MKFKTVIPQALFNLSLAATYLFIWSAAKLYAISNQLVYDVPYLRVILSAALLFVVAFIIGKIFKTRHASYLKIIYASLITPIIGYSILALCEMIIWTPSLPDAPHIGVFGLRLGLYMGRFAPASACTIFIILLISRLIIKTKPDPEN